MKNAILFFCLFIGISCKIDPSKNKPNTENVSAQIPESKLNSQPVYGPNFPAELYELKLTTHKLSNDIYDVEIKMLLFNDTYYASSNTMKDLKGKFTFFINDNNFFKLKSSLIETPLLIKQSNSDQADNGSTNWIRVNTNYKQQLEITSKKDFTVGGFIQFTIEPRCTLEKIPVIIKYKNGVLKFEIDNC